MNVVIKLNHDARASEIGFEIVERKGLGHPDTLCDAIAERASQYYSRHCLEQFGRLAHHWFDKVILVGGEASLTFGRGQLTKPYHIIFCGKAVTSVGKLLIPVYEIVSRAASDVLAEVLYNFDPVSDLVVENLISNGCGPGQASTRYQPSSVQELYLPGDSNLVSNDCNLCVAYAPLSTIEELVLLCEHRVNSQQFRYDNPDTGSDVKIVGCRTGDQNRLTANIPFIANLTPSRESYLERVEQLEVELLAYLRERSDLPLNITVNPEKVNGRSYLTATGSVADTGDVGVVGRGNRANGLITPMRPMSIEAAAGKNPLDHTGKIYTVLANQIANDIFLNWELHNVVTLSTVKGRPITDPEYLAIELFCTASATCPKETDLVSVATERLRSATNIWRVFINDGVALW